MTAVQKRPPTAEFAYIDEMGDTGAVDGGGSQTYTLGCVLIPMHTWTDALDYLVNLRRNLGDAYGLPMSQEVKANHLVGIKKTYSDLGLGETGPRVGLFTGLVPETSCTVHRPCLVTPGPILGESPHVRP
ncbi:hypothetical protein [Nocardia sp. NPDC004750]